MLRKIVSFLLCLALCSSSGRGDVVINEVVHAASDRMVKWDANGAPTIGTGAPWYTATYSDTHWQSGAGPFGFGTTTPTAPVFGTNVQTRMQNLTPTLYLRKTFTVSAADAARTDPLELLAEYNDGFIVYVNGVELARRWAGPVKQIAYHDMPAQDPDLNSTTDDVNKWAATVDLGGANLRLVAGQNVIAVHALNLSSLSSNFLFSGTLRIGGATPTNLVIPTDSWKFFPGVVEPSGGVYDPTLLTSGRLNVPWGKVAYVDADWSQGTGPIGQGAGGVGTSVSGIVNVTPSLYVRKVFTATAGQAADPAALRLEIDYDDSFVAYINGVEVARANLQTPNSFVPRDAVSSGTRNFGSLATLTIDPANQILVEGANVLAIQVHNVSLGDADVAIKADLKTGGGATLVANNTTWKYKIGTEEPVVDLDGAIEDNPDSPESVNDWVELHNNGAAPVSLNGWTLTDDANEPGKWSFPNVTIAPGGYLVVICDGLDITAPVPGGFLHANFKLNDGGEYLGLRDSNAVLVQQFNPQLPQGSPFHSFGRNASGSYVFFDEATPGLANAGNESTGKVAAPTFSVAGGFYASTQSVQLSTSTPGATIRYTLNGSVPTATTGISYTGPISVAAQGSNNGVAIRARAFAPGMLPSDARTNTYLVGVTSPQSTLPVVSLVGDEQQSLYRPFGVMAIKENTKTTPNHYPNGPWTALGDPAQYNNPNYRGRFMERPVNWQMLYPNNLPGFSMDIGVRMAGSPFTRPRYFLTNHNLDVNPNQGVWSTTSALDKPSMNFYMRNDLGGDPLDFPIIPTSPVRKHSDFRFRGGHNDLNPFIIDELVRRSNVAAGQIGSLGINTSLYINGVFKGIFNLCQHVRQEFLQEAFGSDLDWDVVQVAIPSDGDLIDFQEMFTFLRNNPQNVLANYQGMQQRLDMVNFVDYLITNVYFCTGDWPHNNWIAGRERSTTGQWRFFTWDAEGAFGSFGLTVVSNNFVSSPPLNPTGGTQSALLTTNPQGEGLGSAARILYTLLRASPEFKLLFADRIQKHFFNNGAFTDAAIMARKEILRTECTGFISGLNNTRLNEWISGKGDTTRYTVTRDAQSPPRVSGTTNLPPRRRVLLDGFTNDDTVANSYLPVGPVQAYFVAEGLWPATKAPVFGQHGGSIGAGFNLTITNPNAVGSIYYTINGTDPRQVGGAIGGTLYSGPFPLNQTTTVKARVLNTNGQWSPMTEAVFISSVVPPLLITELMYHPADFTPSGGGNPIDGDEYEFIELKNTGSTPLDLFGMRFSDGIDYTFAAGATIPGNGFVVLVKNPARFAEKYPSVTVLGAYGPGSSLNNAGETVTLVDAANNVVASVTYSDDPPWPVDADGNGYSLVPMQPNSNPDPDDATNWRLSGSVNGSPGADDPAPGIPQVQITELLANSVSPAVDAIELFNPGGTDANIGGWFLSDDLSTPKKYRIPDDTIIPAGQYLVLTEAQFNTGVNGFAFSQNGDEAVLSSAGPTGNLTGLMEFVSFAASSPGVSFGRSLNSQNKRFFVAQKEQTFGAANAGPLISDVVMTEIHYFPQGAAAEFIEIRNNGNSPVPLFDPANPANTWRLGGIEYALPPNITLQPRQFLIVAATAPISFRASYSLNAAVSVVGPFNPPGDLANSGERVTLQKPGTPYVDNGQTVVPYIDVDFVTYGPSSPWPSSAAGGGRSLDRANLFGFGDDPITWKASSSPGGNVGRFGPSSFAAWQTQWLAEVPPALSGPLADAEGDGLVNYLEYFMGLNPRAADASGMVTAGTIQHDANGPYLTISFRRSLAVSGVTFSVDAASAGLNTWLGGQTVAISPVVNNGDGTETFTHRDTVPINSANPRFLRVKVTGP